MRRILVLLPVLAIVFSTCKLDEYPEANTSSFAPLLNEQFNEPGDWVFSTSFTDSVIPGDTGHSKIENGMLDLYVKVESYESRGGEASATLDLTDIIPTNFTKGRIDIGVRKGGLYYDPMSGSHQKFLLKLNKVVFSGEADNGLDLTSDVLRIEYNSESNSMSAIRLSDQWDCFRHIRMDELTSPEFSIKFSIGAGSGAAWSIPTSSNQIEFIKISHLY